MTLVSNGKQIHESHTTFVIFEVLDLIQVIMFYQTNGGKNFWLSFLLYFPSCGKLLLKKKKILFFVFEMLKDREKKKRDRFMR